MKHSKLLLTPSLFLTVTSKAPGFSLAPKQCLNSHFFEGIQYGRITNSILNRFLTPGTLDDGMTRPQALSSNNDPGDQC